MLCETLSGWMVKIGGWGRDFIRLAEFHFSSGLRRNEREFAATEPSWMVGWWWLGRGGSMVVVDEVRRLLAG